MRIGNNLFGTDLTALHNLSRANDRLFQSGMRLATMHRINSGSDDPAGLIAVGQLQSELISIQAANNNASRAVGAIHVADSAMGEVGNLLNSIRANVMDVAGGFMSDEQVTAKQIEIDAAVEAINRIGGYASYGGRKLLDGSAGLRVSGVSSDQVTDIQVHYNAGGGEQTPDIEVVQAATSAEVTYSSETGTLAEDVTLAVAGNEGTVSLDFSAGATLDDVAQAVSATSDSSGVTASVVEGEIVFSSTDVGSDAFVSVEAASGTFDVGDGYATGTDVVVKVDGAEFTGQGNRVKVHTETLQADVEFAQGFTGTVDPITVSGGAMTFNFSPNVGQTSMLALPNVNGTALGGAAGRLNDLTTGGKASLATGNFAQAIDVLDSARDQVLHARARAGAFEKYTIQSTQRVLDDMEVNVSAGLSAIYDTDVAEEMSNLIRAQIVVDAAMSTMMLVGRQRGMISALFDF